MPYMYILECADGSYYTGSTWKLEKRLWEHQNAQGANHTAKHLPVSLVYFEEGERIKDAYHREKQIQGWGRKKKQALIAGATNALYRLSECQNDTHWSRRVGFTSTGSAHSGSAQPAALTQPAVVLIPPTGMTSSIDPVSSNSARPLSTPMQRETDGPNEAAYAVVCKISRIFS